MQSWVRDGILRLCAEIQVSPFDERPMPELEHHHAPDLEGVVGAPTVAFGEAPTGSIHARSVDEEKVCGRCLGVAQISRLVNFW